MATLPPYIYFAKFDVEKFKEWIKKHTEYVVDKNITGSWAEVILIVKYKGEYHKEKELVKILIDRYGSKFLLDIDVIDIYDLDKDTYSYALTEEQYKELFEFIKSL